MHIYIYTYVYIYIYIHMHTYEVPPHPAQPPGGLRGVLLRAEGIIYNSDI